MSLATEGFSAMMSFLSTERKRFRKKRRQNSRPSPRDAQNDKCNWNVKQEMPLAEARPRERGPALVHLAFLAVGDQFVENQRVYVASARPKHHQNDHLELVQADDLARQSHSALDDELAQQRGEYLCAFEKSDEPPAFQRQLGCFVCGISAEGRSCVQRLRKALLGQVGEDVQPVQRVLDVVVLEAGGMQLALEGILIGVGFRLVVILEKVDKYVEHFLSILNGHVGIDLRGG